MKVFLKSGKEINLEIKSGDIVPLAFAEFAKNNDVDYRRTIDYYKKHVNKNSKFILAVDDDSITLEAIEAYSAMSDCFCLKAESPEDGYALLVDYPFFDIVFTDLNMPGMNGKEFSSVIKSIDDKVKVVLLTGDMSRIELFDTVDAQIKKPMPFESFKSTIAGLYL